MAMVEGSFMSEIHIEEKGCASVSLTDQIRTVDPTWHEMREIGPCHHRNVPYGRMLHEAADEIERLRAVFEEACNEVRISQGIPCHCKYCHEPDKNT